MCSSDGNIVIIQCYNAFLTVLAAVLRFRVLCNPLYPYYQYGGTKSFSPPSSHGREEDWSGRSCQEATTSYRLLGSLYNYSRPYPHKFQPTMANVYLCVLLCG